MNTFPCTVIQRHTQGSIKKNMETETTEEKTREEMVKELGARAMLLFQRSLYSMVSYMGIWEIWVSLLLEIN